MLSSTKTEVFWIMLMTGFQPFVLRCLTASCSVLNISLWNSPGMAIGILKTRAFTFRFWRKNPFPFNLNFILQIAERIHRGSFWTAPVKVVAYKKENVIHWITTTSAKAKLTASVCTGSFLLAQAGLLDGKRATTHWSDIEEMKSLFPKVTVEDQVRFIDQGPIITSAGISAGIDMSLHLVSRLDSEALATATARQMDYRWIKS